MNCFINNLTKLSKSNNLKSNNLKNIIKLFNDSNINLVDKYIKNPVNYDKKIIYRNNDFELVLINWEKDSFTTYHNHPDNGCVLKVLDGKLIELTENKYFVLNKNDVGFKLKNEYHKIFALEKSYSLHYYSPPNFYNNK